MLRDIIEKRGESVYRVAKGSGLPYTTLNELVLGKKTPEECSVKTVAALAGYFGMSVDSLLAAMREKDDAPVPATTWEDARNRIYHFPVIAQTDAFEIRRVHPLKQKTVIAVYEKLKGDARIESLTLFGSAVTIRCGKGSDVDFAVGLKEGFRTNEVKNEVSEAIQDVCGYGADVLWEDRITKGTAIDRNIRKGVRII